MDREPPESERERILANRRRLRSEYGDLYDRLASLLFLHDPVGINFETNTDEYEPEAGSILPRLRSASSSADVQRIVHHEFVSWVDDDIAGPETRYEAIAKEVWALWQESPVSRRDDS